MILERLFARIRVLKSCTAQCVPTAGLLFLRQIRDKLGREWRGGLRGRGEDCIIGVCVREI